MDSYVLEILSVSSKQWPHSCRQYSRVWLARMEDWGRLLVLTQRNPQYL